MAAGECERAGAMRALAGADEGLNIRDLRHAMHARPR
eukprot:CAMPEP_0204173012 /NCGR_PEP_ID=MMETSP0361-20130328/44609_1 /ASSEMBLY_ACC=CAM_ASM_000343 /TAXON_ID=268821 /ORGANISM="Scrippsiella Hangoei, Strain SHTV-5" /LENGTH=36 /DNA_ID= /DNA_START= /DNA_END= /DNA_ORIENTATION=